MINSPFCSRSQSGIFLTAFAVLSLVIGCGKEENTPGTQTTTLEGNWKVNSLKLNGTLDALPLIVQTYNSSCITDVTFSFKPGGAVSYDTPASCTASATSIATITTTTGIDANSKWSQTGNILTITPSVSTSPPKSFTTTFGASTVQLQGSGLFALPGTTMAPANTNFTLELRKL